MDKKILITAPIGATFKCIMMGPDFLPSLSRHFNEIHIATTLTKEETEKIFDHKAFPKICMHYIENKKMSVWKYLFHQISYLSYNKYIESSTFKIKLKDNSLETNQKLLYFFLRGMALIFGWKRLYLLSEKIKYYSFRDERVDDLIGQLEPDLVFATAISFPFDFPYIYHAKKMGILVVGMVHSWDNLSTKGPIFRGLDKVIVWNQFQQNEILPYYEYNKRQIKTVGIPQLDFIIQNAKIYKKSNLARKLNLDKKTYIILYGTGAPRLMPWENKIVENIAKAFQKGLDIKWHLRVRLHPQDKIERYNNLKRYKNVSIEMVSENTDFVLDGRSFNQEGLKHYGELLYCCDLILNIASTVGLEAVVVNTPTINIAFDDKERDYPNSIKRYYDFAHMRFFSSLGAYKNAMNIRQLIEYTTEYLKNKHKDEDRRIKAARVISYKPDGLAGKRISKILIETI